MLPNGCDFLIIVVFWLCLLGHNSPLTGIGINGRKGLEGYLLFRLVFFDYGGREFVLSGFIGEDTRSAVFDGAHSWGVEESLGEGVLRGGLKTFCISFLHSSLGERFLHRIFEYNSVGENIFY